MYDITRYVGLFCCHGVLGLGANCFGGKRYGHATLLLLTLVAVYGVPIQFYWYDIGCRYKIHLAAWIALQSPTVVPALGQILTFELVMSFMRAIKVVVPPFHHYAHSASCQAENSGKHAVGAGRAAGQPPENAWSFFGTFNRVMQRKSLASRADFMARLRGCWNESKARGLPELLTRMHLKARVQAETAGQDAAKIHQEATEAGIRLEEVRYDQLNQFVCCNTVNLKSDSGNESRCFPY